MAGLEGTEPIAEKFGACSAGEKPLTVKEIMATPLSEWTVKAGEGCKPSDMDNFEHNVRHQVNRLIDNGAHNVTHQIKRMVGGFAPSDPSRGDVAVGALYNTAKNSLLQRLGIDSNEFDELGAREQSNVLKEKLEGADKDALLSEVETEIGEISEGLRGGYETKIGEIVDKFNDPDATVGPDVPAVTAPEAEPPAVRPEGSSSGAGGWTAPGPQSA